MIINSYILHNGGQVQEIEPNDPVVNQLANNELLCLGICYDYSYPDLKPWGKIKHDVAISSMYDVGEVICGDFSVWCDEKQDYVKVDENTVVRNGNKYIYFVPCHSSNMRGWKEVTGEFELNFYLYKIKIKVKC